MVGKELSHQGGVPIRHHPCDFVPRQFPTDRSELFEINRDANDSLYSLHGLTNLKRATKPGGVVAIWSAAHDDKFARRFAHAGFTVTEHKVGAAPSGKGPKHVIWVGVVK